MPFKHNQFINQAGLQVGHVIAGALLAVAAALLVIVVLGTRLLAGRLLAALLRLAAFLVASLDGLLLALLRRISAIAVIKRESTLEQLGKRGFEVPTLGVREAVEDQLLNLSDG